MNKILISKSVDSLKFLNLEDLDSNFKTKCSIIKRNKLTKQLLLN